MSAKQRIKIVVTATEEQANAIQNGLQNLAENVDINDLIKLATKAKPGQLKTALKFIG